MSSNNVKVKVTKTFEGEIDAGDLGSHALKWLLDSDGEDHCINVYELNLTETSNEVEVSS